MIPSDLAARLRALTEGAVQALAPVRGVPAELPDFRAGDRITATIVSAQPDGTLKAEVAGKTVTLAMAQYAKPGDTLELQVVDRTLRSIVANRTDTPPPASQPTATPSTTLSRGAQVIGTLLTSAGETDSKASTPLQIRPILQQAPSSAQTVAPLLQSALAESGVFYEAHQALWVSGKLPLTALLREPQGRYAAAQTQAPAAAQRPADPTTVSLQATGPAAKPTEASAAAPPPILLVRTAAGELTVQTSPAEAPKANAAGGFTAPTLPADLAPVVRQQLDTLSNDLVLWQGQVWPGQNMEWEIENARRERSAEDMAETQTWTTTVRLTLPHLGKVAATLKLDGPNVALALHAAARPSADALRGAKAELAASLEAAGVPLREMSVKHGESV